MLNGGFARIVVGSQVGMPVVPEAVPELDLGVYASDGQVHLGETECRLV